MVTMVKTIARAHRDLCVLAVLLCCIMLILCCIMQSIFDADVEGPLIRLKFKQK